MGGLARGVTYGTRLWMEAQLGGPGVRQRYLSMVEASSTLCKVVAPAWALLLLSVTDRFESIFLSGGLLFLALLAVTRAQRSTFRVPQPYQLVALWWQKAYWGNAPYFLVEGAGHALRTALFVSGAMTVVGSLKSYARVEMCASLLAAAWLLAQGRLALPGPSLRMLRKFLCLLALAWGCLLAALWSSWWLPGFVVLYAVSLPLVSAQKAGVTLNGMVQAQGALETHLMARSLLLTVARVCTLAVFGVVHWWGAPARDVLVGMVGAALLLLPLEYWTARRMQPATKAPAQGQGH